MYESTRNNKTVFGFAVRDTQAAWKIVQKYMSDKYFRPHEEFRDLYYTTAPGLGMQYLQFFKTEQEIQVVTFLGGPVHPVPLAGMPPQAAESVRTAMKGLLDPLRQMEVQEAAPAALAEEPAAPAEPVASPIADTQEAAAPDAPHAPAQPEHWYTKQEPIPTEIPAAPEAGFVGGEAPAAQPTANEFQTAASNEDPQPATFGYGGSTVSRQLPRDPAGTRYAYDPVNGGARDRASNATAGLVLGIIGLFMALLGMGMPAVGVLGLLPLAGAIICSVNGRHSVRRGIGTAGLVISLIAVALVVFETLVWFDILRG